MPYLFLFFLLCRPALAFAATMNGLVLDADGQPVAGATVWLTQERQVETTHSDKAGAFEFRRVGVGFATVVAWKEGHAVGGNQGISVDDSEFQIVLPPPGRIVLRVLSPRYEAVAGARVKSMFLNSTFSVPVEDLVQHGFPALRSDDEGLIPLDHLPPRGHLQLVLSHYDFADAYVAYLPIDGEQHEVVLEEGLLVNGRVLLDEAPVPAAVVQVAQMSTQGPVAMTEALADPEGYYSLRLPEGTYLLTADHPKYAPAEPTEVVLQVSQQTIDLEVRKPRQIAGEVALESGEGAGGVGVEFRRGGFTHAQTVTQENGSFVLESGYAEGTLIVHPPAGYLTETLTGIPVDLEEERKVKLKPVRLERIPAVAGQVVDESGEPFPDALVTLEGGQMPLIALSNPEGMFRLQLDALAPDADFRLRAEHPLRFLRATTEVDPRQDRDLTLRLAPYEADQAPRGTGQNALTMAGLIGKPAPPLTCDAWLNTQEMTLADLKGKVVVLTFWGGFDQSPYGLARLLELNSLYALFRRQAVEDVAIIGVHDASIEPDEVEEYLAQYQIAWPVGCDADPFKTFVDYGINFIPQTVLIDKSGVVRYHDVEGRLLELIKVLRRKAG